MKTSSLKLKFSMYGSVAAMIAIVTIAITLLLGIFTSLPSLIVLAIIIPLFLLQWRFAPQIIERAHNVKPASEEEYGELHKMLEEIAQASKMEKPKLVIAETKVPNAFAYGNRWSGKKIAVTQGLLNSLELEEVEAVLGHEIGHHKHGDAKIMMFLSILPAIFLMIGRMFLLSGFLGGGRRGGFPMMAIAGASMGIYFVLNLCIMNFSRMREFLADKHSARIISDGSRKLSEGLAKINYHMGKMKEERMSQSQSLTSQQSVSIVRSPSGRKMYIRTPQESRRMDQETGSLGMSLKPLFIADPDTAKSTTKKRLTDQELVDKYKRKEMSLGEKILELFSSHPNVAKRLKALESYR